MSTIASLSRQQLLTLQPGSFSGMLDQEDVVAIISATDSFWVRPTKAPADVPHAELTSGKCSDGFVNLRIVLSYTNLCGIFARQLVLLLRQHYDGPVDWVVGSHTAATGLSHEVASLLQARWYPMQKTEAGQELSGVQIPADSNVLRVEELITTFKTTQSVSRAVLNNQRAVNLIPFVPVIVHRPEGGECEEVDGAMVIYLAHFDINVWQPADCPLCALGSKPLRANVAENWQMLVESVSKQQ